MNVDFNRDMEAIKNEMQEIVNNADQDVFMSLEVLLHDEELRLVVGQMEQNLSLLQLLYPMAIVISIIIGAGFAMLLMLQNAKVAAIIRVLGYSKVHTRVILCAIHIIVVIFGVIIGLIVLHLLGFELVIGILLLAILYIIGSIIGSIIGAATVTSRAPLDLLQVRE